MKKSTSMPAFNSLNPKVKTEAASHDYSHDDGGALPGSTNFTLQDPPPMNAPMGYEQDSTGGSNSSLKFSSSSQNYSGGGYIEGGDIRRTMSHQDFPNHVGWEDHIGIEPGMVKGKSVRHGLLNPAPVSKNGHPLQRASSKRSAQELDKHVSFANRNVRDNELGDSKSGSENDLTDKQAQEQRRLRRLARNRASARMRRMKKKTMADSLEVEMDDLIRSIKFLGELEKFRKHCPQTVDGCLGYPRGVIEDAYIKSQEPLDREKSNKKDTNAGKSQEDNETPEQTVERIRMELRHQDNAEIQEILLKSLVTGKTQDRTISVYRRKLVTKLFEDSQIAFAELIRQSGAENDALYSLAAKYQVVLTDLGHEVASHRRFTSCYVHTDDADAKRQQEQACQKQREQMANGEKNGERKVSKVKGKQQPNQEVNAVLCSGNINNLAGRPEKVGMNPFPCNSMYTPGGQGRVPTQKQDIEHKMNHLRADLLQTLQLTEQQKMQIQQLGRGLQKEQLMCQAFYRVAASLSAHNWLDYPEVEQIQDGFRGVLLVPQIEKFHNWSKRNANAIEALDIAPSQDVDLEDPGQASNI